MIWIALVIGVFLFYYFVPWKHKKRVFIGVGVLAVVGGLFLGALNLYFQWESSKKKSWKTVKFLNMETLEDKLKLINVEVCNNREDADLHKITLHISGYHEGRSTAFKLKKQYKWEDWEGYTELVSDQIVKSKSCETIIFIGHFREYAKYDLEVNSFYDRWSK